MVMHQPPITFILAGDLKMCARRRFNRKSKSVRKLAMAHLYLRIAVPLLVSRRNWPVK